MICRQADEGLCEWANPILRVGHQPLVRGFKEGGGIAQVSQVGGFHPQANHGVMV
jgi:hypothetical protein